jgi:hypothetical protein
MEEIERKLILFIKTMDEDLEDAHYCNQLTSELLEIVKVNQTSTTFKQVHYTNQNELNVNIAKYYVKGAQIYSAIQKINVLDQLTQLHPELSEADIKLIQQLPSEMKEDTHLEGIVYNYAIQFRKMYECHEALKVILGKIMGDTFLPSLEEMDELVVQTKEWIRKIKGMDVLDRIELYTEKKKFVELNEKIFSMY